MMSPGTGYRVFWSIPTVNIMTKYSMDQISQILDKTILCTIHHSFCPGSLVAEESEDSSSLLSLCYYSKTHLQRLTSLKGASKWKKFPLISAHRYYGLMPHKLDILTSFLKRIWVKLFKTVSQSKIGWFLWFLDQIGILNPSVTFYWYVENWLTVGHWFCQFIQY